MARISHYFRRLPFPHPLVLVTPLVTSTHPVARKHVLTVTMYQACRPRMVDLVEAGVGGALGEDTFAKCLQVRFCDLCVCCKHETYLLKAQGR